jgi:hypothetical protein
LRSRSAVPRLSLALSLLALVVALSGAAVAAGLAANSVGTKQLKKNAVTAKKIRANAVTGAKIKDGALTGADIADGTVGAGDLAPGLLSAQPVVLEHALSAPAATSVTVVAGIEFRAQCTAGGGEGNATWSLDTVGGTGDMSVSAILSRRVVATDTTRPLFGSGFGGLEVGATGPTGGSGTMAFEGTVRVGSNPWVRVSVGAQATGSGSCAMRAVVSVLE